MSEGGRPERQLALNSAVVSGFTGLGVVFGFAIDLLIATRFGLGSASDAYYAAVLLPVVLLTAVLLSSQSVLVVALTGDDKTAWPEQLFSTLVSLAVLAGLGLAALGALAAPLWMRALAPGFDPPTLDLAVGLGQILFLRVPAALVAEVLRPALFARRRFGLAAAGYFIANAVTLVGLFARPGAGIRWVAWSVTLGTWVGLAWVIAALVYTRSGRYRPILAWRDPAVKEVGRALLAPLTGLTFRQGIVVAERWFGSFLGPGSVAALGYANKIVFSLAGVVFDGVATAGLPTLANALAAGESETAARAGRRLLGLSLVTALLLGGGLALISHPLAALLFRRSGENLGTIPLSQVGGLLAVYSLCLLPLGPFRALQSLLYAARRTDLIGWLLFLAAMVTLLLDWPLVQVAGVAGLGWALGAGLVCAALTGLVWIRRRLSPVLTF